MFCKSGNTNDKVCTSWRVGACKLLLHMSFIYNNRNDDTSPVLSWVSPSQIQHPTAPDMG
jgi:hypothetical protein